ncbi:SCO family protein [bacterium]|nr:SCO family protein [bacterium]
MSQSIKFWIVFLAVAVGVAQVSWAADPLPRELNGVGIKEHLGAMIPTDAVLTDSEGQTVSTSELVNGKQPIVLVFAYYTCPMLCNLVLTGVQDAVGKTALVPGERYRIITISIDPKDTTENAKGFKEKYTGPLKNKIKNDGWRFFVGPDAEVRKVADAVGFNYAYNPRSKEYAHAAGIIVLTPEGKISRYLYGIEFKPTQFKLAVLEASDRKIISVFEGVLLFCYNYDAHARGYALVASNVMKVGGFVTVVALAGLLVWLNLRYKDRK